MKLVISYEVVLAMFYLFILVSYLSGLFERVFKLINNRKLDEAVLERALFCIRNFPGTLEIYVEVIVLDKNMVGLILI